MYKYLSLTHRIGHVGRDLWRSSRPTLLLFLGFLTSARESFHAVASALFKSLYFFPDVT